MKNYRRSFIMVRKNMVKELTSMPELVIGNLVAKVPIVQGGMGVGISLSSLAAAVANEGGIGVISAVGIGMGEKDIASNFLEANKRALRREIGRARELSKGIIGVNIMVALSNYEDIVKTSVEEGIDIIFSGAGLPLNLPKYAGIHGRTKLVPIVSSEFKQTYINCKKEDIVIIKSPVGLPGRAIRNKFIEDAKDNLRKPFKCTYKCIKTCEYKKSPYCIAIALMNAKKGDLKDGFAFAGQNAYRITQLMSVNNLIESLKVEFASAVQEDA